ncbi:MAG: ABC-2 family transporter protein [Bacilli bacterium]|nr:ABC-2 family transporter protein [Bacilli bacterium]
MKKYLNIFKATLINELQYISDIVLGFLSFLIKIFIFLQLWNYLYDDPSSLIAGFSKDQMIWYVIMTEMIWYGTRNKTLTNQITDDIKSGSIAYALNKPYSYIIYIITKHFGEISIKFILYLILALVTGFIFVGPIDFNILNLPFIIIIFILSFIINAIIRIIISMLSFFVEDSTPFHWIYDKIIIVLGIIFPIEVFPLFLQPILKFTPIYVVTYGPAKLVIDFSYSSFITILLVQIIYLIMTILLLALIYKKGVRKLNVNGG